MFSGAARAGDFHPALEDLIWANFLAALEGREIALSDLPIKMEGWLSPVEGTRLEIERRVKPTVGSNPTPSAIFLQCLENEVSL